jgi:hypothetical protein
MRCLVEAGIAGELPSAKQIVLGCTPQRLAKARWVRGAVSGMDFVATMEQP